MSLISFTVVAGGGIDMDDNRCTGSMMGTLFGHKFKPRFSVTKKMNLDIQKMKFQYSESLESAMDAFKDITKTYCGDVCTRCGKVVNKG